MANTGNLFPTTGENVDRAGLTAWTTPGNVTADDAADATCNGTGSDYLVARNFDLSSIPDGATINGILVRVEASEHSGGTEALSAQLQDENAALIGASAGANEGNISGTAKAVYTFGSAWGFTPTTANLKNANFGVRLWFTTAHDVRIDFVTIAVEYTENLPIGDAAITLPIITASATASSTVEGLSGVTLPVVSATGAGSSLVEGAGALSVPMLSLSAGGNVGDPSISGSGALSLPAITLSASASAVIVGAAALTLPVVSLAASGSGLLTALGAMTVPLIALAASGSSFITGLASLVLPIITLAGTASEPSTPGSGTALSSSIHPTWLRVLIPLLLLPSLMELFKNA